jgi:predicted aminopeptidase
MIKKIGYSILVIILFFLAFNFSSVRYGIGQGIGQTKVLFGAVPLSDIKSNPKTPDSILNKIQFIEEVRKFAIDSIGLDDTENYTTFYDQKDKPILWVVTASPEFKIEAHQWCFPIAGCFPYKGYFDYNKALVEEQKIKNLGFDTRIGEVSAWSTLGFFKDPILSSMLNRGEGKLADLIIHELTHATLYVKNDIEFNENLANFIGKQGAIQFLKSKYGDSSAILHSYKDSFIKRKLFSKYMTAEIENLNQFYLKLDSSMPIFKKRELKQNQIDKIKEGLLTIGYYKDSTQAERRLKNYKPNNAFFSGFSTYSNQQNSLDELYLKKYQSSLKNFIEGMKKAHGVD